MFFFDRSVNGPGPVARHTALIALLLLCASILVRTSFAQDVAPSPASKRPSAEAPSSAEAASFAEAPSSDTPDTSRVSAFVKQKTDSLFAEASVPGWVVVVTTSDTTLVLRAGGSASIEENRAMDPESTVVRTASASKPVTATLVKTLDARGVLDLDGRVPPPTEPAEAPRSITFAHLLAHTSGLDGRFLGGGDPIRQPLLGSLLQRRLPPQIDSVGVLSRYSNEGYAWAGVGAARAADSSFPELAASNLFEPLGMERSTFDGDAALLDTAAATGYEVTEQGPKALRRDYITLYPAGGLWTTGRDMSAFLAAILKTGGEEAALPAAATRFEVGDPRDDFAGRRQHLGWFHRVLDGHDLFVHGGSYPGAGSYVLVAPDLDLGIFVAGNASSAEPAGEQFAFALVNEWAEMAPSVTPSTADAAARDGVEGATADLSAYEGTYRIARRPHTTFESFFTLFGAPYPDIEVRAVGDTALTAELADGPATFRLIQHDAAAGADTFTRTDAQGLTVTALGTLRGQGPTPRIQIGTATFEKIGALQSRSVQLGYMMLCLALITSIFYWPIREFFRPGTTDDEDAPEGMQYARPLATFAAALHVGFLFALAFRVFTGGPLGPIHTDPGVIRPLLAFPIVASSLSLGLLVFVVRAWLTDTWSVGVRVHFSAVTLGMIIYIPFLLYWDLIGVPVA